jgi:hypothetical protein
VCLAAQVLLLHALVAQVFRFPYTKPCIELRTYHFVTTINGLEIGLIERCTPYKWARARVCFCAFIVQLPKNVLKTHMHKFHPVSCKVNQTKEVEVGAACGPHGNKGNACRILVVKREEKRPLGIRRHRRRIILTN